MSWLPSYFEGKKNNVTDSPKKNNVIDSPKKNNVTDSPNYV